MTRLLAALLAALALLAGCGDDGPADGAAALVPADTLVLIQAGTDPERDADRRLLDVVRGFDAAGRVLERLPANFDLARDVRPWLGEEAALALVDTGTPRANVLILARVADRPKAEGFLSRVAGAQQGSQWRGIILRRFSNLVAAFVGEYLVIGQDNAVRESIDIFKGHREPLSVQPAYERVTAERPKDRGASAWVSPQGVRRVLQPLAGIGGVLGAVLDHPRLEGVGASVVAEDDGLRLRLRLARPAERPFEPELAERVPEDAAAYIGINGLEGLRGLLGPIRRLAEEGAGLDFETDVLEPLRGEAALSVTPRLPVPLVTLIAKTSSEARTREAMARLQPVLAESLAAGGTGTFETRRVAGVEAFALPVSAGFELIYAVADGRLTISTAQAGLEQALEPDGNLTESDSYGATVADPSDETEALAFVDLSELLSLGEQTGATGIPAVSALQDDLRRIRAAGAVVKREEPDTTAELFFEIP